MPSHDLLIAPPVSGSWAVYNPPGHPPLAFDLLAVDARKSLYREGGFLRHLVTVIPVEDTYTWAEPVFSPVAAEVVACHDAEQDRREISFARDLLTLLRHRPRVADGFRAFGGNHILLRAGDVYVLLCHLRQGSARVRAGDAVTVGQPLAEVGNSGASLQPHLHLQVMRTAEYFPLFANLLPFKIDRGAQKHGGDWVAQEPLTLENRGHYFFAEHGSLQ